MNTTDRISTILKHPEGATVFIDGVPFRITDKDVETLKFTFPSECENCGYDPDGEV